MAPAARPSPAPAKARSAAVPAPPPSRWDRFLANAEREVLAVSYWFDPPAEQARSLVRIRLSGHRTGTGARTGPRDRFASEEAIEDVGPASGRISVTARIRDVEPGEWVTTATVVGPENRQRGRPTAQPAALHLHPAAWSWRSWSLGDRESPTLRTTSQLGIKVPAMLIFVWGPMVFLGVLLGLTLQAVVGSRLHLSVGRTFAVSVVSLIAGAVGAKLWYAVIKRGQKDINGWCIQGFLLGFTLVAPAMATLLSVPIGTFLDVSAAGIFLGAVPGRLGCFLAGCCGGRPTTSRWGVWSSDQRVGRRRIPTQLMEAGLAAAVSIASLSAVLSFGPRSGTLFVASVAAYTLVRQGILRLRAERRVSVLLGPIVTAVAAAVLLGDVVLLAVRAR